MTPRILIREKIKAQVLKVLSGYCFRERHPEYPEITILSPWISDVQLEIDKETYELDELWFGLDYGILSINLAYALLLLKLDWGAAVRIVTLPANERNYHERASWVRNLLDFLDEIGCDVYVNPDLHSKLILSNDLALIGSFNLSKSALYDREEIGVCIDDISNLKALQEYAQNVIASSTAYGYTHVTRQREGIVIGNKNPITSRVTRGWLYERLVAEYFHEAVGPDRSLFDEFLIEHLGTKSIYLDGVIKEVALNLDAFYTKAILKCLQTRPHMNEHEKAILGFLRHQFDYRGVFEIGDILGFLKTKLARPSVPKISIRMVSANIKRPNSHK